MTRQALLLGRALVALGVSLAGCVKDAGPAPCTTDGRCLDGYQCVSGFCEQCPGGSCEVISKKVVGPGGGPFCGVDGVCIDVPPGALASPTELTIRRPEPQPSWATPQLVSKIYELGPATVQFLSPATVRIPVTGAPMLDHVAVFRTLNGTQSQLPQGVQNGGAAGTTMDLGGEFAAGLYTPVATDAGFPDAMPGMDALPGMDARVDAGQADVGFPDGGAADVGFPDVGFPDGGTADVGFPDGGTPDVGFPDGGTPDVGFPDAGTPDVGFPDTGTPDAGFPDTGTPDVGFPDAGFPDVGFPDVGFPDVGFPDVGFPDAGFPDVGFPDSGIHDPLVGIGSPQVVSPGHTFLEGPVWNQGEAALYFTDIGASTIYRLDTIPTQAVNVFRAPSAEANGLAFDNAGQLLACEHASRQVTRTVAGSTVAAAADYQGALFNSPNDLVVRRSDGTIYFSDPPYGLGARPREIAFNGVFRITPAGVVVAEVQNPLTINPNGVELSLSQTVLYVADTLGSVIRAYDVAVNGSLSGERLFVSPPGGPDGLALDSEGNLYAATSNGIEVYAPDGSHWGRITIAGGATNCAFGDSTRTTLYVTTATTLYSIAVVVPGAP